MRGISKSRSFHLSAIWNRTRENWRKVHSHKASRNPSIPGTKAKPLDGCTHRNRANSTLLARAAQFLGHGTLWRNKGPANGPTAPLSLSGPSTMTQRATIHHSSLPRVKHSRFLARQIPIWSVDGIVMLIMRRISRWIVIEIPPFVALVAYLRVNDQLSMYRVLKLWIFVFLFFF